MSDVESVASELAIVRSGKLIDFDTPDRMIAKAQGQVWSAQVSPSELEQLRTRCNVLYMQRHGATVNVRIAHPHAPCQGAEPVVPSLEEALMAQRYANHASILGDTRDVCQSNPSHQDLCDE